MVKIDNKVWQQALSFTDGNQSSMAQRVKKNAVLYFYPRANTPGCTNESKDFSELYEQFQTLGCEVIGVSADSLKKQQNFKKKYDMPFELVADVEEVLCQAFAVIVEKNMYGKKFMGIERSTFILDGDGKVLHEWRKVKVPEHAKEVLTQVKEINQ
ncbi:peroxiredoxin [Marinicella sp. S1101]|uniref:peroxiredoxin n=1 Tax=Marinicella marina TaxID=2996016 RepID=UPI002260A1C9|nr:peroxiredoxin [Marinicella marina]MCX7554964.1 peroxiredoxin [Marinicella marina]MDJ1141574.1 peroxiredoxin [Marinicella marina]